jgi:hypothetical protein
LLILWIEKQRHRRKEKQSRRYTYTQAPDYNAARQELKDADGEILARQQAVKTLLHLALNTGFN